MAINLEILDASQSQLTQNEQVKNLIDKGCDVVCVNLVDRTDEGIEAVKNEEMLGTVYNDKEGQAREMLNLAFVIATANYAQTECQFRYCGTAIPFLTVRSTAR